MPVYNESWDETKPAGSRDRSLGDDDIREFKRAIRERLETDHEFDDDESGNDNIGYHKKVTLTKRTAGNPTVVDDCGVLFTKDAGSGRIELFYIDPDGNVTQLTAEGVFPVLGEESWRTGDKLLSSNTNTPEGWTDQSSTYNDSFIRISSGTPLTTGGANTHDHGAATGSTTLTGAQSGLPAHSHSISPMGVEGYSGDTGGGYTIDGGGSTSTTTAGPSNASEGHTHSISSANNVPVYVQMKIYSKN